MNKENKRENGKTRKKTLSEDRFVAGEFMLLLLTAITRYEAVNIEQEVEFYV